MKRKVSEEERALFKKHVAEQIVRPAIAKVKSRAVAKASTGALDGTTAEKLRRGQLVPGGRIDLHGMTEGDAHHALQSFLTRAQANGVRLVLVITGIGNSKSHESVEWMRTPHGVLKEMVPRWLSERDFAALTSGWAPAHRRHGGGGALYVYLRKKT